MEPCQYSTRVCATPHIIRHTCCNRSTELRLASRGRAPTRQRLSCVNASFAYNWWGWASDVPHRQGRGALDPSTGGGGASGGGGGEKGTVMFASGLRASIRGNSASGALDIAPAPAIGKAPPAAAARALCYPQGAKPSERAGVCLRRAGGCAAGRGCAAARGGRGSEPHTGLFMVESRRPVSARDRE